MADALVVRLGGGVWGQGQAGGLELKLWWWGVPVGRPALYFSHCFMQPSPASLGAFLGCDACCTLNKRLGTQPPPDVREGGVVSVVLVATLTFGRGVESPDMRSSLRKDDSL